MSSPFAQNIQDLRKQKAEADKQKAEFQGMITEMQRTQAAVIAGGSKPSVVLTDQTDLGDKIKELTAKVVVAIQGLNMAEDSKQEIAVLKDLHNDIQAVESAVISRLLLNARLCNLLLPLRA